MSLLQTYRNIRRVRHIATVLLKHGFGQVAEKLDLQYRIFIKRLAKSAYPDVLPLSSPSERARMVLEDLGPTFVKLGQVLSTRPDLIPKNFIVEFKKLQDRVPPISFQEVADQIALALGKPLDQIFASFNVEPIASASIGQVHRARLAETSEEVVVKVQRPFIRSIIESDLNLLYFLAKVIEREIPETQMYSPIGIIEEFDKAIHRELDYTIEAHNMTRFQHNFEKDPTVYIPKVYRNLSTRTVLITEYIHGTKISELVCTPGEKKEIARIGFQSILKQIFLDGFFHGDPHPGNIFVLDNHTIAFLDFGMMGRLDQEMKNELADLLVAVINQDVNQISYILANLGTQTQKIDMRSFRNDVADILDRYYGVPLHHIELGVVTREMIEVALKYRVKIPSDYTLMIKALLTIESIGKQLDPDLNAIEEAKPMVTKILKERWDPHRIASYSFAQAKNLSQLLTELPLQLNEILEELRQGRLRIAFEHVHLERLIFTLDALGDRISASLVIAALIIGSSIIMHTNRGPIFMGFPLLGIIGFVSAGILGFWLLLSILRSGKL